MAFVVFPLVFLCSSALYQVYWYPAACLGQDTHLLTCILQLFAIKQGLSDFNDNSFNSLETLHFFTFSHLTNWFYCFKILTVLGFSRFFRQFSIFLPFCFLSVFHFLLAALVCMHMWHKYIRTGHLLSQIKDSWPIYSVLLHILLLAHTHNASALNLAHLTLLIIWEKCCYLVAI